MTAGGRTPQRRIAETVAATLRARILSDRAGDRLPTQDQLVREFGVSYPSVREALRILETEGLVTVRRGSVGELCRGEVALGCIIVTCCYNGSSMHAIRFCLMQYVQLFIQAGPTGSQFV